MIISSFLQPLAWKEVNQEYDRGELTNIKICHSSHSADCGISTESQEI